MERKKVALFMAVVTACSQIVGTAPLVMAEEAAAEGEAVPVVLEEDMPEEVQALAVDWQEGTGEAAEEILDEAPETEEASAGKSQTEPEAAAPAEMDETGPDEAASLNLEGEDVLAFIEEVDTAAVDALGLGAGEDGEEEENPIFFSNTREENFLFLFEGEEYTLDLNTEALEAEIGPDYEVEWQVGLNSEEGLIPNDEYVTYTADGSSLTLTGIQETPSGGMLGVYAEVKVGEEVRASAFCGLDVRPERYDYDYPWFESQQLPGWWDLIDRYIGVWVENPDHPYRDHMDAEVTDVTVAVDEGEADAVTVEPWTDDEGNSGWTIHMNSYGHAVVTVKYVPIEGDDGNPGELQYDFWVGQDNWGINLDSDTRNELLLPGSSLTLTADVWHHCYTEDQGYFEGDTNVGLEWNIEENGSGAVSIEPGENQNVCRVSALPDAQIGSEAWVSVRAYLLDEDGNRAKDEENNDLQVAYSDYRIEIQAGYYNIVPVVLGSEDLAVGESIVYAPQLQSVWLDENGAEQVRVIEDEPIQYRWEWDMNAVEITDADGKVLAQEAEDGSDSYGTAPFTIRKLENWYTGPTLIAELPNENGDYEEVCRRGLNLQEVNYDTWFDDLRGGDYTWVYNDEDLALSLNTENLDKPEITVEWQVGNYENDEFIPKADESTGAFTVYNSGLEVTVHGDVLQDYVSADSDGVNLEGIVYACGKEMTRVGTWVQVREPGYWLEDEDSDDLLVGSGFRYDDDSVHCYVENGVYPYGEEIVLGLTEITSSDEEVLQVMHEGNSWFIEAAAEGEADITYVTVSDELGEKSFTLHKTVRSELYRINVYSESGDVNMLPNAALPLHTDVEQGIYNAESGTNEWRNLTEGYTLEYLDYDENLITVDEDGVVTALGELGDTYVLVKMSIVMENGETYERFAGFPIYVRDQYARIGTEAVTAEPGETVAVDAVKPVLTEYTVDDPDGHIVNGVAFVFGQTDAHLQVSGDGKSFTVSEDAVTAEDSPSEAGLVIRTVIDTPYGEEIIENWCTVFLCVHDWDEGVVTKAPTCTEAGERELTCNRCESKKVVEEPMTAHTAVVDPAVAATCTEAGKTEGSHCAVCGAVLAAQAATPALGHSWDEGVATKAPTCMEAGVKTFTCTRKCGASYTEAIAAAGHTWGAWQTVSGATVFAAEVQQRTCSVCGAAETRTVGSVLTPTITLNATSIPLKAKQSTTKVKVSGLAAGDYVKSWASSNTKVATVDKTGKITAKNAAGKSAVITVALASGLQKKITVKVQKSAVKTTKISGLSKKLTIKKGQKQTLAPVIAPITSLQKVTFSSSNKKVATVTSKGVIIAKASGTAKITVKSGSKKFVVTVTVPKVAPTAITGVPAAKALKKGKSVTLKPKLSPAGSEGKITYTSSNKKVAAVNSKGKITGKQKGTAVITVKVGKISVKCTVTVK